MGSLLKSPAEKNPNVKSSSTRDTHIAHWVHKRRYAIRCEVGRKESNKSRLVGKEPVDQSQWNSSLGHRDFLQARHSATFFWWKPLRTPFLKMKYLPRTVGISITFLLVSLDLERGWGKVPMRWRLWKTSQELRMLSRSLSDFKSLTPNVRI